MTYHPIARDGIHLNVMKLQGLSAMRILNNILIWGREMQGKLIAVCGADRSHKIKVDLWRYDNYGELKSYKFIKFAGDYVQYRFCKKCGCSIHVELDCPKSTGDISSCDEGCAINGCADYVDGKEDYEPPQVNERTPDGRN